MRTSRRLLVISAFSLASMLAAATMASADVCSSKIFFGNGIRTPLELAALDGNALQQRINDRIAQLSPSSRCSVSVALAYNDTYLMGLGDLFESYLQLSNDPDENELFWRIVRGLVPATPAFVAAEAIATAHIQVELGSHLDDYRAATVQGLSIVVVAHSQGNLYANEAFGRLGFPSREIFRVVSVATPAGYVAGEAAPYTYTTLIGDVITNVVGALPGNISNDASCLSSVDCHSFSGSYLTGRRSGRRVVNHVIDVNDVPRAVVNVRPTAGGDGISNNGTLVVDASQSPFLSFSAAGSSDDDGFFRPDGLTWNIDGTGLVSPHSSSFEQWLPVGIHMVTLTVVDDLGSTATAHATIVVRPAPSSLTGEWIGTYAWNCSPAWTGRTGSSAIRFMLNDSAGRISGTVSYLGGISNLSFSYRMVNPIYRSNGTLLGGSIHPDGVIVRLSTNGAPNFFVYNEFDGEITSDFMTITGSTLNGDSGSNGCSALDGYSGTFTITRVTEPKN